MKNEKCTKKTDLYPSNDKTVAGSVCTVYREVGMGVSKAEGCIQVPLDVNGTEAYMTVAVV